MTTRQKLIEKIGSHLIEKNRKLIRKYEDLLEANSDENRVLKEERNGILKNAGIIGLKNIKAPALRNVEVTNLIEADKNVEERQKEAC